MTEDVLTLGTRRYSSWSLRGWLAVRLAGLDVADRVLPLGMQDFDTPNGLVPSLKHDGVQIYDSLAICEYCAELSPALWPTARHIRAHARSISAEMHAGFRALRLAMPMNLGRPDYAILGQRLVGDAAVARDLARIAEIWRDTRARFGKDGPFLFGPTFGVADAMFAPVVTRLLTYQPPLSDAVTAYCNFVRSHALIEEWYALAAQEPEEWQLARYENLFEKRE